MVPGTVSIRMLWPFMRVLPDFRPELELLQRAGFDRGMLADTDARIPRPVFGELINSAIQRTGDAALGVHAGERTESADFGVMDHAVRACSDVRSAIFCIARYTRLQDDQLEMHFIEEGNRLVWQLRNAIPPVFRASNDFQVTVTVMNLGRRLGVAEPPLEVHLRHTAPTDAAEYARVFRAPVVLGTDHNAVVIPRATLDLPIPSANPDAFSAFDMRAEQLLKELERTEMIANRVRRLVTQRIGRDAVGIIDISSALHMSPATLRRRLAEENTTYRAVLDDVRRELALRYVAEPRVAVGEIAFLLGFSTQSAFGTAFRRWTGLSPLEHRQRLRAQS